MRGLRKRYRVLIFAALAAALIVPVGYALSIDSKPKATRPVFTPIAPAATATVVARPLMMPLVGDLMTPVSMMYPVSDSAKLLCIGTVLFGLAAAVRKVI
jgi:hypothetical protein